MTYDEAAELIGDYQVYGCGYCHQGLKDYETAFQMAIEVLKEQSRKVDEVTSMEGKE